MRTTVLAGVLSLLLMALGCFGQAYTYQDEAFMRSLMGLGPGGTGIPVCRQYTANLIRYWKMVDPAYGNWLYDDVTQSPISASMNNGAMWVNDGPYCKWNNAQIRPLYSVQCPNYNSWCNGGTGSDYYYFNIIATNYSVSVWTYHFNVTPNAFECAIGGFSSPGDNFHFGIGIMEDKVHYGWGDVTIGNATYVEGPTIASVGANWTFWVMSRTGNTWTLWKNDPVSGPAVAPIISTSQGFQSLPCSIWIGNAPRGSVDNPRNWQGYICEAMIYKDYGLSSNDVWCLYHQYYGR